MVISSKIVYNGINTMIFLYYFVIGMSSIFCTHVILKNNSKNLGKYSIQISLVGK